MNPTTLSRATTLSRVWRTAVVAATVLYATTAYAQEFKKTATAGFAFLNIPVSAREAATGESGVALFDVGANATFANPAALGFADATHSVAFSYAPWFADVKHYAAAYQFSSSLGTFALGATQLDYGTMPRTVVASGNKVFDVVGEFGADALSVNASYARALTDRFSFGVTLKYVRESIDVYDASNALFDGGVVYFTGFGSLRIAATMRNFGVDAKFINDEFKMPSTLRLGAAAEVIGDYESDYRLTLMLDASHPNNADERVTAGAEFEWMRALAIRGGYKFFYDEETYSFGVGVSPNLQSAPIRADFSYADYGRLGATTRFTLRVGLK
jgi:hypothetical protein